MVWKLAFSLLAASSAPRRCGLGAFPKRTGSHEDCAKATPKKGITASAEDSYLNFLALKFYRLVALLILSSCNCSQPRSHHPGATCRLVPLYRS